MSMISEKFEDERVNFNVIMLASDENLIRLGLRTIGDSSNINEVIRAILNLFVFFYKKILHTQKPQNAYKRIQAKKTAFLCA